jgi:uncharacterized protein
MATIDSNLRDQSQIFKRQYGPWALIAGGSDGIGAAFAREVAARGINLILIARRREPLCELSLELQTSNPGIEVRILSIDLASACAIEEIKDAVAGLEIGCLIYNVGAESNYGDFLGHEWALLYSRIHRNLIVKIALVHHFGRAMRGRLRGGIILMGSIAGVSGTPGFALYSADKAFAHNLSEGLWYEFKKDNVHLLCPIIGTVNTPTMIEAYGPVQGPTAEPDFIAQSVIGRIDQGPIWVADDIAEGVSAFSAMLPADRATYMAGMCAKFGTTK